MGHYGVVVRDGEGKRLRVHNNVPYEFCVVLSREDVVYAFLFPVPLKVCEMPFWGYRKTCSPGRDHGWKRKLTGAHYYHFACLGRRHRALHSVHSLVSYFLYVPSER